MKHFFTLLFLLVVPATVHLTAQQHKGNITGRVVDLKSQESIPGATVLVLEKSKVGASTDIDGRFSIHGLEVGAYSLRISAVGFLEQVVTNVVVATGRANVITIKLEERPVEVEGMTIQADYFQRGKEMSPVSANVFDRSEILRSPGSIQDVQRVVQNLPGVASSYDNINELIVRGGAPYENLTIMDNMEIPSINHYSNQFNSAGPINMVNADMIEDAQFSAGGFPAQFGDKSSSVLNLTVREGDRTVGFASKTGFNMAGIGTLIEGGFAGGKGSYIFSARNSLLEAIDKVVGLSKLSLTAIPKYWDSQVKLTYDVTDSHKLIFNALYGDSRINFAGDPTEKDENRKNAIDTSSVFAISPVTKQYTLGLTLRSLLGSTGYSALTFYGNGTSTDETVREKFSYRRFNEKGEVVDYSVLNTREIFSNKSNESFVGAKYDLFLQLHPQHDFMAGAQFQTSRQWSNHVTSAADTLRYDLDQDGVFEIPSQPIPPLNYHNSMGFGIGSKYFVYASDTYRPWQSLKLTFGLRYDHFNHSGKGNLSPRFSIAYQIFPQTTTVTFATGTYSQTQPFPYYGSRTNNGLNRELDNLLATHYVLGFEHIFDLGLKLSVEGYYKTYKNQAVSEQFIHWQDQTFDSDKILTVGSRYAYGVEFFLEQKQVTDYYGTVSVSLSRSFDKDPRAPQRVSEYPSGYDYPVIVTLLGGKIVKGVRDWLNDAPFYLKYPAYILPISNEMEFGFKYRYQSGRPHTPNRFVTWKQDREGGIKWSKGTWIASDDVNSERYPDYSRLDFQWISRFYFNKWNINLFLSLQNVLNTKNVFFTNYRSDGTTETVYQFSFFPVAGVEVEF